MSKSTDLSFQDLENKIPEPHPSWVKVIEGWIARLDQLIEEKKIMCTFSFNIRCFIFPVIFGILGTSLPSMGYFLMFQIILI